MCPDEILLTMVQPQGEWKQELRVGRITAAKLYARIGQAAHGVGMESLLPTDYHILNGEAQQAEYKISSRAGSRAESPFGCGMMHETVGSENCTNCLERMQGSVIAGA